MRCITNLNIQKIFSKEEGVVIADNVEVNINTSKELTKEQRDLIAEAIKEFCDKVEKTIS